MKKIIAILLVSGLCLSMFSCSPGYSFSDTERGTISLKPRSEPDPENVVVVEGCEYFVVNAYTSFTYVHKGNCKNPIHPENK